MVALHLWVGRVDGENGSVAEMEILYILLRLSIDVQKMGKESESNDLFCNILE